MTTELITSPPPSHWPFQLRLLERANTLNRMWELKYGAGKSSLSLAYASQAAEHYGTNCVAFIFCRSHLIQNWVKDIAKWHPSTSLNPSEDKGISVYDYKPGWIQIQELYGKGLRPLSRFVVVLPHHRMAPYEDLLHKLIAFFKPAALIVDESTAIKNPGALTTQAAHRISKKALPHTARICLTGRAAPENRTELWAQIQFCYPSDNPLGASYYQYLRRYFVQSDRGYRPRLEALDEIDRLFYSRTLFMTEEDDTEHKEKIGIHHRQYTIEYYELTKEQRDLLDYLYTNWALPCDPASVTDPNNDTSADLPEPLEDFPAGHPTGSTVAEIEFNHTISLLMKAQQITSGFYYDPDRNPIWLKTSPKVERFIAIVEQLLEEDPFRRIVVWTAFKAERLMLSAALQEANIKFVEGPDQEALDAFAEPWHKEYHHEQPNLILMPVHKTQGYNDMVVADTDIYFSNIYSQEKRDQAEARIDRPGQLARIITHIDLSSGDGVDADIVVSLQAKNFTQERARTLVDKYTKPRKTKRKDSTS